MTCVIALVDRDRMYMACDSAASSGDRVMILKRPKFHRITSEGNPDLLIGCSGRAKSIQVLGWLGLTEIPKDTEPDPHTFIVQAIVPRIEALLEQYQLAYADKETGELVHDNQFIIAYRGSIFTIGVDFYALESAKPYNTIGSGGPWALCGMDTAKSMNPDITPEELIMKGMEQAVEYSAGVRGPFQAIEISTTESTYVPKEPAQTGGTKGPKCKRRKRGKPRK
jgi:ATP-dependent protease HslVU (ClpYQ) peptidase subunit